MENFTNIKFNKNLVANKACKITYSGLFFQNGSDSVTIVYGFNNDWKESSEKEMKKTTNGFVAEINMLDYDSFNFCFRNSNYEWDNNYYQNYTSPITKESEKNEMTEDKIEDYTVDKNVIGNVIDNSFNDNLSKLTEINGLGLENIINSETDDKITSFEVSIEKNDPINIEETLVNSTEETTLNNDIENLFEDIYKNPPSVEKQDLLNNILSTSENKEEFSMNSLIDEILSPIVSSSVFEEENLEVENEIQFSDTPQDLEADAQIDNLIDGLITDIYKNTGVTEENLIETNTIPEATSVEQISTDLENSVEESENSLLVETEKDSESLDSKENTSLSEDSLLDTIHTLSNVEPAVKETSNETSLIVSPRSLSKFYIMKKKLKIAFYRFVKLFSKGPDSSKSSSLN